MDKNERDNKDYARGERAGRNDGFFSRALDHATCSKDEPYYKGLVHGESERYDLGPIEDDDEEESSSDDGGWLEKMSKDY